MFFGFDGGHTPELGRGAGGAAGLRSLSKRVVREESIIFKHSQPEGDTILHNFALRNWVHQTFSRVTRRCLSCEEES